VTPTEQAIIFLLGFEPKHISLFTGLRIDPYQKHIEVAATPETLDEATEIGKTLRHFRDTNGNSSGGMSKSAKRAPCRTMRSAPDSLVPLKMALSSRGRAFAG
jgi:hypothetical protein